MLSTFARDIQSRIVAKECCTCMYICVCLLPTYKMCTSYGPLAPLGISRDAFMLHANVMLAHSKVEGCWTDSFVAFLCTGLLRSSTTENNRAYIGRSWKKSSSECVTSSNETSKLTEQICTSSALREPRLACLLIWETVELFSRLHVYVSFNVSWSNRA